MAITLPRRRCAALPSVGWRTTTSRLPVSGRDRVTGLRVATANAASGRHHRTGEPDLAAWADDAADLDVDVLAVQEVDHLLQRSGDVDQTAVIAAACARDGAPWQARFAAAVHGTPGDAATFGPALRSRPEVASYGVALLSRHPVSSWWEHRMAPSRARLPVPLPRSAGRRVLWVPDEPRVALAGRVQAPGGGVTVVCTHLSFAPVRAAAQLREVRTWAASLPRPLVLLGDLNLPGAAPGWITGWLPAARGRTFPSARPRVQLDHVLVDDPSGVLGADRAEAVAESATVVLGHSDHRGLVVGLGRGPG